MVVSEGKNSIPYITRDLTVAKLAFSLQLRLIFRESWPEFLYEVSGALKLGNRRLAFPQALLLVRDVAGTNLFSVRNGTSLRPSGHLPSRYAQGRSYFKLRT